MQDNILILKIRAIYYVEIFIVFLKLIYCNLLQFTKITFLKLKAMI